MEGRMSVILRPDFPDKPHRIPISGAEPEDIQLTASAVDLIFYMARHGFVGQLENLAENLPMDQARYLDTKGFFDRLDDLRHEILGKLQDLEDWQ